MRSHPVSSTAHVWGRYKVSGRSGGEDLALAVLMSTGDVQAPSSEFAMCFKTPFMYFSWSYRSVLFDLHGSNARPLIFHVQPIQYSGAVINVQADLLPLPHLHAWVHVASGKEFMPALQAPEIASVQCQGTLRLDYETKLVL